MKLDSLTPVPGSTKNRKRVGRGHGSGSNKSAGRGDKGAQQRSGFKRRPWFEGGQMALARRLPKRGFTSIFKKEFQIVNLEDIETLGLKKIDANILRKNGLVRSTMKPIKILGNGNLTIKVDITASAFSAAAKSKIEKADGKVTVQ
ncbi:MAG: 50S ribosomal protein L15 [Candidatus Marinimicrobia bacterium]|jgi:large subunit ribosomal protein L15|nr:50S ribosomal protein L15 [Candidatus Neomarinimicrobiota bacterium]MBT3840247.1 50S ribosomal protein L15 [Candidatus Neomarinimicrobiota bacterium]MBT4000255.1 50S ribosomal protein L15 [Candidatus Neomarinimicrobiota bacterium]MBT4281810.1 50S ribosomal protein L15 [Candidatus Neomarinimicrobiota bacterium]MBT4580230.1 50S ribosomal protein L15 [Candidatus Neomarinimicrobiota bacterium]